LTELAQDGNGSTASRASYGERGADGEKPYGRAVLPLSVELEGVIAAGALYAALWVSISIVWLCKTWRGGHRRGRAR
jgi:hypothetical protein